MLTLTYHDTLGYISLTMACVSVSVSVSMHLLSEVSDLDVNIASSNGDTALHLAVWCSKDYKTQLHRSLYLNQCTGQCLVIHLCTMLVYKATVAFWRLMLEGADETITNDRGKIPTQLVGRKKQGRC